MDAYRHERPAMRNEPYDVCVVGAGPAGSAAALTLARAGRRVLVLDARTFPRDKPCGDLLGTEAIATLGELDLQQTASDGFALEGARVYGPAGGFAGALAGAGSGAGRGARVIARQLFDARLLAAARDAGATFAQARVRTVARNADRGWSIATTQASYAARAIVGADGYGSRVASAAGRRRPDDAHLAVVVRGYADGVRGLGDAMHFFVNATQDGYGWIFPLGGGRANIGLGFVAGDAVTKLDVRAAFERFVAPGGPAFGFLRGAALANVRAWPIPLGWQGGTLAAEGLFLAGDAAALASPLSGSGIHHALASGAMAAVAAGRHLDGDQRAHERYARQLAARFAPRLRIEHAARRLAGTPARVEPLLRLAHALPFADRGLARALLTLG